MAAADDAAFTGGWNYSVPMLSVKYQPFTVIPDTPTDQEYALTCDAFSDYVFQDASGTRSNLGLYTWNTTNYNCVNLSTVDDPTTSATVGPMYATTDSQWLYSSRTNPVQVYDADGTQYSFGNVTAATTYSPAAVYTCTTPANCAGTLPVSSITDRNGNAISVGGANGATTYTDSVGRTLLSISSFGSATDSMSVLGYQSSYKVNWTTVSANFSIHATGLDAADYHCSGTGNFNSGNLSIPAISSIVLPNGQQYSFQYGSNGLISKITPPYWRLHALRVGVVSARDLSRLYLLAVHPHYEPGWWSGRIVFGTSGQLPVLCGHARPSATDL